VVLLRHKANAGDEAGGLGYRMFPESPARARVPVVDIDEIPGGKNAAGSARLPNREEKWSDRLHGYRLRVL
jgi:hypothetical protein